MNKKQLVVVEVRGGCVVEIYSDDMRIEVNLIDWDCIDDFPNRKPLYEWGQCAPLCEMPQDTSSVLT